MKEVIKLEELTSPLGRNTILSHCIFHTIAALKYDELTAEIRDTKELTVEMSINGRPVSLRKFLSEFERQHEWMLTQRAKEVFHEKMSPLMDTVFELERHIKAQFNEAFGTNEEDDR